MEPCFCIFQQFKGRRFLGDTEEKQITFYAVDRKKISGEPITYNIIPLTPSYIEAYNTLETNETFGGIAIIEILLQVTLP